MKIKNPIKSKKPPKDLLELLDRYKGTIKLPNNMTAVEYLRKYSR